MARRRTGRMPRFRRDAGRQGLWARFETFTPTDIVTAPKFTENAVIFPSLWEREFQDPTQPKRGRGGALLKRLFGSVAWEIRVANVGTTVNIPVFEVLVFSASDTEPASTAAADFNTSLETKRVLHYSMQGVGNVTHLGPRAIDVYSAWIPFDVKVAARLPGQEIIVSTRCSESENVDTSISVRVQASGYITTP